MGRDGKERDTDVTVRTYEVEVHTTASAYRMWPHDVTLLFGAIPLPFGTNSRPAKLVYNIEKWLVGGIGASITLLISIVITAFFIPNMLRKGTVDLLLAKPIHRVSLLGYKYVGGMTFMFLNTSFLVGCLWLVIGVRSGIWNAAFLLMIFVLTFQFAIFYSVSTVFAVLTRSPIVCILMSVLTWALLLGVGWAYWFTSQVKDTDFLPKWAHPTAQFVHFVLPHYEDVGWLAENRMYVDLLDLDHVEQLKEKVILGPLNWAESLAVTTIQIFFLLGIACWRFAVKDY
jgi:ABC-type transport system involved in multi-copper enzyme maturation permease subunit